MTGLYPRQGGDHLLGEAMVTMAEALKKVGLSNSHEWQMAPGESISTPACRSGV